MGRIFFTADTHFGHGNIIKHCSRPFGGTTEMDQELIRRWNEVVGPEDTIYHLGDFSYRTPRPGFYFEQLNGRKHLVIGNHDKGKTLKLGWSSVEHRTYLAVEGRELVLDHYAMRTWKNIRYGAWHLFGHTHGRMPPHYSSMDVGVDTHDFRPWSWEEVVEAMRRIEEQNPFNGKGGA